MRLYLPHHSQGTHTRNHFLAYAMRDVYIRQKLRIPCQKQKKNTRLGWFRAYPGS